MIKILKEVWVLYLLSVLPGPVDVVAPGNDDRKLVTDTQSSISHTKNCEEQNLDNCICLKIQISITGKHSVVV